MRDQFNPAGHRAYLRATATGQHDITEWRIETREPGGDWAYVPFSMATDRDEDRVLATLVRERERAQQPGATEGWEFRLTFRQGRPHAWSPWQVVDEDE